MSTAATAATAAAAVATEAVAVVAVAVVAVAVVAVEFQKQQLRMFFPFLHTTTFMHMGNECMLL